MKNFSLKALGASFIAAGLVLAGVVAPAYAAAGNLTPTTTFTASTANAAGLTFSTGPISANPVDSLEFKIYYNTTQWRSFAPAAAGCSTFATCKITSVKFGSITFTQEGVPVSGKQVAVLGTQGVANATQSNIKFTFSGTARTLTNEALEVVFDAGALTAPSTTGAYTFSGTVQASSFVDYTGAVTVSSGSTPTPTPSPSSSTSSDDPTLANTGFDGAPYLSTGAVLALAGVVLMLFARRRQTS